MKIRNPSPSKPPVSGFGARSSVRPEAAPKDSYEPSEVGLNILKTGLVAGAGIYCFQHFAGASSLPLGVAGACVGGILGASIGASGDEQDRLREAAMGIGAESSTSSDAPSQTRMGSMVLCALGAVAGCIAQECGVGPLVAYPGVRGLIASGAAMIGCLSVMTLVGALSSSSK